MVTSRTRTSSFSNGTRCDPGAATASIDGGQVQRVRGAHRVASFVFAVRQGSAGGG